MVCWGGLYVLYYITSAIFLQGFLEKRGDFSISGKEGEMTLKSGGISLSKTEKSLTTAPMG